MSMWSGFWSFLAVLVPAGGSGSEFFIALSLLLRSFCLAFSSVILAMARPLSWVALFLLGF
jgi:hypothetical protein